MNEKENQKMDELSQKLEAIDQQEALTHPMIGTRRWFFRALTFGIGGAILGNTKMVSGAPSQHDVCPKNSYLAEPYYCEGAHDTCTDNNTCVSGNVCQQSNTCTGINKCNEGNMCNGRNTCNTNTTKCPATENVCSENTCGTNTCNANECTKLDKCTIDNECHRDTCVEANICFDSNIEYPYNCVREDVYLIYTK